MSAVTRVKVPGRAGGWVGGGDTDTAVSRGRVVGEIAGHVLVPFDPSGDPDSRLPFVSLFCFRDEDPPVFRGRRRGSGPEPVGSGGPRRGGEVFLSES